MKYDIDSINKRRKEIGILKKIIGVLFIILIYNIIITVMSINVDTIQIFGYKSYIITSNSMEPSICLGDVIVVKKCNEEDLHTGDVITFEQDQNVITHRILKIEKDIQNSEIKYITKGDNNNIEDSNQVEYSQILGKEVLTIPYLGKIISLLDSKIIILVVILILLILCFLNIQKQEKLENRREKKKIEERKQKNKTNF